MDGIQPILVVISIHSPLAGRDPHQSAQCVYQRFQSTRPSRGETAGTVWKRVKSIFQSTRPSRGETRRCDLLGGHAAISIHSPLAGRDSGDAIMARLGLFQSTRPSRGETRPQSGGAGR